MQWIKLEEIKEQDLPWIEDGIKNLVLEREEMEQALLNQTSEEFEKIWELMAEEQWAKDEGE